MSNLFSTRDGYYFEIRNGQLVYLGPTIPDGRHQDLIDHIRLLFAWFEAEQDFSSKRDYGFGLHGIERDDALARSFAGLLGAEIMITPNEFVPVIRLDEAA